VLGIDHHRAQFQELELVPLKADPPLPVQNGAAVFELDRDGGEGKDRTSDCQPEARDRRVESSVQRVPSALAQTAGTPKRR